MRVAASCTELKQPANYHWPTDVPENVDYGTLADAIRLAEAVVRRLDETGSSSPGAIVRAVEGLLATVLPLALGAAIAPTILTIELVALGGKVAPRRRGWAIALGYAGRPARLGRRGDRVHARTSAARTPSLSGPRSSGSSPPRRLVSRRRRDAGARAASDRAPSSWLLDKPASPPSSASAPS